jgi:hypothetical protein
MTSEFQGAPVSHINELMHHIIVEHMFCVTFGCQDACSARAIHDSKQVLEVTPQVSPQARCPQQLECDGYVLNSCCCCVVPPCLRESLSHIEDGVTGSLQHNPCLPCRYQQVNLCRMAMFSKWLVRGSRYLLAHLDPSLAPLRGSACAQAWECL